MSSSLTQQIAEWIHARPNGAVSADVVEAFDLTTTEASRFMNEIKRGEWFTVRIEYYNGNRLGRRLYVDEIRPVQDGRAMPVVGENKAKQRVRFPSIGKAASVGGFDCAAPAVFGEFIIQASNYYQGSDRAVRLVQIRWPDAQGRLPDEEGFDMADKQDLLPRLTH